MPVTRASVKRTKTQRLRRLDVQVGDDIRRMRGDAGVSIRELAAVVGVHRSHLARLESGQARASLDVLVAIGAALGADCSVRFFAGSGPRLHDRIQAVMIEAFLKTLDPRWRVRLEVPVTRPGRGVIDIVLDDRSTPATVSTEAQSELRRLEQQVRWSNEKSEGLAAQFASEGIDRHVSRLLILRSTVANRALAGQFVETLGAAYPARCSDIHAALTSADAPWPGAGIVWMRVDGAEAIVLSVPPRGVSLGR